jgi:ferredoxin
VAGAAAGAAPARRAHQRPHGQKVGSADGRQGEPVARRARRGEREEDGVSEGGAFDVKVDWDLCMGSGNCMFWAPDTFDLSDDGHAVVTDPAASPEEKMRIAAQGCPVGAISLWRNGTQLPLEEEA